MSLESTLLLGAEGFSILYGLVIGSFWNVCISRMPHDRSIVPRSQCPSCSAPIAAIDNVPILSWIALGGKCRSCSEPISVQYPLVELLGGLLAWLLFRRIFMDVDHLTASHAAAWVVQFGFLSLISVGAYVDVRYRILPDQTTFYAVPFGIAAAALLQNLGYDGWMGIGWRESVLATAFWGLGALATKLVFDTLMGREALGWGDVKLAAMIGAFTGLLGGWFIVFFACLIASVIGIAGRIAGYLAMPLGPAVAAAAALWVFYGQPVTVAVFPGLAMLFGLA